MRIDFVTLFPDMLRPVLGQSIMGRAVRDGQVEFGYADPRDFATDKHRTVDDTPYGGGPGMVMKVDIVAAALRSLPAGGHVVLTDPRAPRFEQAHAERLGTHSHLVFICGHYEGVDERVRTILADEAFSIGDFVMTGGEIAALAMADAVVRLRPGVLGDAASHEDDSFSHDGLLGFPLYTRPDDFEGHRVPDVLKSGDHGAIARWRRAHQLQLTRATRPDLFARADLKPGDLDLLSLPVADEPDASGS